MLKAKSIYSIIFLSVLFICTSKNSFLFALYELDARVFVNLFCENIKRPELKCNGHCALAQLSKEQNQKDGAPSLMHLQEEIFFYFQNSGNNTNKPLLSISNSFRYPIYLNIIYTPPYLAICDKPPELLS